MCNVAIILKLTFPSRKFANYICVLKLYVSFITFGMLHNVPIVDYNITCQINLTCVID